MFTEDNNVKQQMAYSLDLFLVDNYKTILYQNSLFLYVHLGFRFRV